MSKLPYFENKDVQIEMKKVQKKLDNFKERFLDFLNENISNLFEQDVKISIMMGILFHIYKKNNKSDLQTLKFLLESIEAINTKPELN